jgi:hypothetical protein
MPSGHEQAIDFRFQKVRIGVVLRLEQVFKLALMDEHMDPTSTDKRNWIEIPSRVSKHTSAFSMPACQRRLPNRCINYNETRLIHPQIPCNSSNRYSVGGRIHQYSAAADTRPDFR